MTRIGLILLLTTLAAPAAAPAVAHVMTANKGTVAVKEQNIYVVLSVPVSALSGFDDNADARIDADELGRHASNLRTQIDGRVRITADGAAAAEGLTFVVSPLTGDHAPEPTDYVVAMIAQRFESPPRQVEVWTDLFGPQKQDQNLMLIATRDGAEERAVLKPKRATHRFFRTLK